MSTLNRFSILYIFFSSLSSFAQVSIGVDSPATSAMLDVASTTKGFLLPRMTVAQLAAISNPASGLMVWCTDCSQNGSIVFKNDYGWSDFNQNSIVQNDIPNVSNPTQFTVQILNSSYLLMWSVVANATDYIIKYRIQGTENWTVIDDGLSTLNYYNFTNSTTNGSYEFAVAAVNGTNYSTDITALPASIPTSSSSMMHQIISTGQSLSVGYSSTPVLSLTQPFQNQMLNTDYSALIPLAGAVQGANTTNTETISCGMANTLTDLTQNTNPFNIIVSLCGVNSQGYSNLKKGTTAYTNGINRMIAARNLCYNSGKSYMISAVTTIHGETDRNQTEGVYAGYLNEWQSDYEADAKVITGQTEGVPLFTDQMSSWSKMNSLKPTSALGQLKAALENPTKIILVTPKYIFDYSDGLHLKNYSERRLGEYYGKVMKKVLVDHETWLPLSPASVVRLDNTITIVFNVPVAPLAFDIDAVAAKANYGFEYFDDSSTPPTITNVALAGPTSVIITLSAIPTGNNKKIAYAYTGIDGVWAGRNITNSIRGNLRDSDVTPAYYQDANVPVTMGNLLRNWCVTFIRTMD